MDRFRQILYDLGKEIGTSLFVDDNHVCQLNYMNELHIQLQFNESRDELLISTFLVDVPPGKYREKLLKACLSSNDKYPRVGTLAYSEKNNKLVLFDTIIAKGLKGETLLSHLQQFIEKGKAWKEAVEKGRPLPEEEGKTPPKGSIFGLK